MSNELTVSYSVSDIEKMAITMANSRLFGFKTKDEALTLMLIAQAEGKHPATIAQDYDIIQGRPAIKSQAALARFQASGGHIKWTERSAKRAAAVFSHPSGGELEIEWTMERATLAGLTGKDNWKKFPNQMLAARVVAEGVRACFPACLNSLYTAEEVQDFDKREELPPAKEVKQAAELPLRDRVQKALAWLKEMNYSDDAISDLLLTEDWENATQEGVDRVQAEYKKRKAMKADEEILTGNSRNAKAAE